MSEIENESAKENEKQITEILSRIYRIKQVIACHAIIAENASKIRYHNFFGGLLQHCVFHRYVLIELFVIIDFKNKNGVSIQKIVEKIATDEIAMDEKKKEFLKKFPEWKSKIQNLEKARDKHGAHLDKFCFDAASDSDTLKIDYEIIFLLVSEIEEFIISISSEKRASIRRTIKNFQGYDNATKELENIMQLCNQPTLVSIR